MSQKIFTFLSIKTIGKMTEKFAFSSLINVHSVFLYVQITVCTRLKLTSKGSSGRMDVTIHVFALTVPLGVMSALSFAHATRSYPKGACSSGMPPIHAVSAPFAALTL